MDIESPFERAMEAAMREDQQEALDALYATCARCGRTLRLSRYSRGRWITCPCGWCGQAERLPERPLVSGAGLVAGAIGAFAAGRP